MQTFIDPDLLERLRVGPLAPYLDAYLKRIQQVGFLPSSVPMQMYAVARFSNWLRTGQVDLHQMDEATVQRFLQRDPNVFHSGESAPLRRFLAMLREMGVTAARPPEPRNSQQRFVDEYRRYLVRERGLAETNLLNYVPLAEQFLSNLFGQSDMNLPGLTASDVTKFLQDRARQFSHGRAKLLVTALRSFLRYLRHQGEISVDLAGCVAPVAAWSLSSVPKFLPAGTVQRIIDHCERDTPDGKRNYAVLLLLAGLGLRACEIVALSMDDIDWDKGRITIRCKGGRWAQLPLPPDVGEAVASYLRSGRPRCVCRHVFLRHRAPIRGFAHSITVSTIVKRALIRAGIDSARKGVPISKEFASFLDQAGSSQITSRLASSSARTRAPRSTGRPIPPAECATDPKTEIPPEGLLPYRPRRAKPYFYSDEQIEQLLEAAKNMPATHCLQPWTYHCLFGLLAVTGLRISEALNLRSSDIDWPEGILTIRASKFGKSRLIPLHASTLTVLSDYGARRDLLFVDRKTPYFFCSVMMGGSMRGRSVASST